MSPGALEEADVLEFGRILAQLKQSGSTVLVTGSVRRAAFTTISQQMLGDASLARRRLFVLTDATADSVHERLPITANRNQTRIIEQLSATRGSTAAVTPTDETHKYVYSDDLLDLFSATFDAISTLEVGAKPADLRVCFDSLVPLIEHHGREDTFRAVHLLCWRIRRARGLGHVHLQTDDEEVINLFAELFDAHVELREQADVFQQRWHLRDQNVTTDWLTFEPTGVVQ